MPNRSAARAGAQTSWAGDSCTDTSTQGRSEVKATEASDFAEIGPANANLVHAVMDGIAHEDGLGGDPARLDKARQGN